MELSNLLSDELLAVCDTSSPEVDVDALFATAFQEFEATPIHANRCPPPRIVLLQNGSRRRKLRLKSSKLELKGSQRKPLKTHNTA